MTVARIRLTIFGVVQGVGFRPHVVKIARSHAVTGWVTNTDANVVVELQGAPEELAATARDITSDVPPLAFISFTNTQSITPIKDESGFVVAPSHREGTSKTLLPPDTAMCEDCRREFHDPANRRYHYPFITCTNCGPRLTIIRDLPYDRPRTTMVDFPMCPACNHEYTDPADRRYHAQPISCYDCGPTAWLEKNSPVTNPAPLTPATTEHLRENVTALFDTGAIVAVKGIGGFHLMCDATNEEAVATLRQRKNRPDKPFAVMVPRLPDIPQTAAAPIELLPVAIAKDRIARFDATLAPSVNPRLSRVGLFSPYSPLHELICDRPLVATSGNISGEPLITTNDGARAHLGPTAPRPLADALLLHNRPIHLPVEDSVVLSTPATQAAAAENPSGTMNRTDATDRSDTFKRSDTLVSLPIRRSRGFAPLPVHLPGTRRVLAVGGDMKNTFTLTTGHYAHVSPHIGEMHSLAARRAFRTSLAQLRTLTGADPELVVCDMHPDFATADIAADIADSLGVPLVAVQHHHAHALSLLAENPALLTTPTEEGTPRPTVAVATLDGTGYGTDATIWGGEILLLGPDRTTFTRSWHLPTFRLVGGDAAVRSPHRIALGLCRDWGLASPAPIPQVELSLDRDTGTVRTSSLGRLFDACAYLVGLVQDHATYEGQAAMEFEALALTNKKPLTTCATTPKMAVEELLADPDPARAAARFHLAIGHIIGKELKATGADVCGVSGGCAANQLLVSAIKDEVGAENLLTHHIVPPGDGGLSLGQALYGRLTPDPS